MGDLNGRTVVVTGAASPIGLGHAMAVAMLAAGARVAFLDTNEAQLAEAVTAATGRFGSDRVLGVTADVSDEAAAHRAIADVRSRADSIDILVNNAGINVGALGLDNDALPWDIPVPAWRRVAEVNYLGPVIMTNALLPSMIAQGYGRIIGITTSLDTMWRPISPGYGPAKAAHEAFIANIAPRLTGSGVTANVLTPGGVTMTGSSRGTTLLDPAAMLSPLVMGPPAVWLASPGAHDFNGMRIIACRWDESLPLDQRVEQAAAPAAWPGLGKQAVNLP
jgi:NAD(P)-dependent dehydrogenase (short-subunit alcohol dehydrogenase family)